MKQLEATELDLRTRATRCAKCEIGGAGCMVSYLSRATFFVPVNQANCVLLAHP